MTPADLLLACAVDAAIGDPQWLPHPVRGMGYLVHRFEQGIRLLCVRSSALRLAGIVLALGLPAVAFLFGWMVIVAGTAAHEWIGQGIEICLASTTLAWRDLIRHVGAVSVSLKANSVGRARTAVALIVGRDTDGLSRAEVIRATVETLAESASDGVIAPLLYLAVGGAPLALAYKAVSTLDSIVGHRDERFRDFGWASAKLDDLVNWIPARMTGALIVVAAGINFRNSRHMIRSASILWRDGHKHPSPNSGRPEASMAGALGVRLGGMNMYGGVPQERPLLGDGVELLSVEHIDQATWIVTIAYLLAVALAAGYRWS